MNYKKIVFSISLLVVFSFLSFTGIPSAKAITVDELNAQIQALLQQIQQLQAQIAQVQGQPAQWCYDFYTNLRIGDTGKGVQALQTALGKEGLVFSSTPPRIGTFDEETASAITGFQEKYKDEILTPLGLKYGTGFVGSATRAKLNKLYGCGVIPPVTPSIPVSTSVANLTVGASVLGAASNRMFSVGDEITNLSFSASGADITINSVKLYFLGAAANNQSFAVNLIDSATNVNWGGSSQQQVSNCTTTECSANFTFNSNPIISAGATKTIKVRINSTNFTNGSLTVSIKSNADVNWNANASAKTSNLSSAVSVSVIYGSPSITPSITVLSPNGGETWQIGKDYEVKWNISGTPSSDWFSTVPGYYDVSIKLYKGGNFVGYISTQHSGSNLLGWNPNYIWNSGTGGVYNTLIPGNDYSVRVSALKGYNNELNIYDSSDAAFSIVAATTTKKCYDYFGPTPNSKDNVSYSGTLYWDYCSTTGDVTKVYDYACDVSDNKIINTYTCASGYLCYDGACTPTSQTCTDSDGGLDYNVKGTAKGIGSIGVYTEQPDRCDPVSGPNALAEAYCDNGIIKTKTYTCPDACQDGACVQQVTCTDSDSGKDYYAKGITKGISSIGVYIEQPDSCDPITYPSGKGIAEYYCSNSKVVSASYECPNGCKDGVCNNTCLGPSSSTFSTKSITTYNDVTYTDKCEGGTATSGGTLTKYYCSNNELKSQTGYCSCGCGDGICKQSTPSNCVDKFGPTPNAKDYINYLGTTYSDYCTTGDVTKVYDYACDTCGNKIVNTYTCASGYLCYDGACTPTSQTCTDSDGGLDYNVKGTAKGIGSIGVYTEQPDRCDPVSGPNALAEAYCDNGIIKTKTYTCPDACQDGACVTATSTPSITVPFPIGLKEAEDRLANISAQVSDLAEKIRALFGSR